MNPSVVVFGISADSSESHAGFAQSLGLKFSLLADDTKAVCRKYDALNSDGSLRRITYIIGPDGTIRGIDGQVDAQIRGTGEVRQTTYGSDIALLLSDWKAHLDKRVPNFMLPNVSGDVVPAYRFGRHKATVFLLGGSEVGPVAATCASLSKQPAYAPVRFLAILPKSASATALDIETSIDQWEEVQPHFDLPTKPSVVVVDGQGRVRYRGKVDDVVNGRERNLMREALDSILAGRQVAVRERL